jgi:glycosyltransferase involved in cell wall biosynthesis
LTIYPPVDVEHFQPAPSREDYYITVGRFVPYKRTELIVEAMTKLDRPLVVIGDGPGAEAIRQRAGKSVEFVGWQSREKIADYLSRARAFVFAADEDFGIAPVEAQAAGCPVIAYRKGGALETVIEHETGVFFDEQTVESLTAAIKQFEQQALSFDSAAIAQLARQFSAERFKQQFAQVTDLAMEAFGRGENVEAADYAAVLASPGVSGTMV